MDTILNLIPIIGGVIAFCALWWKMATSVATKSDIATMKTELREDIASIRTEFKEDIDKLRTEFKEDIASVRAEIADVKAELKADIGKLRTEFKEDIASVRAEIADVKAELKADIDKLRTEVKEDITEVRADIREIPTIHIQIPSRQQRELVIIAHLKPPVGAISRSRFLRITTRFLPPFRLWSFHRDSYLCRESEGISIAVAVRSFDSSYRRPTRCRSDLQVAIFPNHDSVSSTLPPLEIPWRLLPVGNRNSLLQTTNTL